MSNYHVAVLLVNDEATERVDDADLLRVDDVASLVVVELESDLRLFVQSIVGECELLTNPESLEAHGYFFLSIVLATVRTSSGSS